VSGLKVAADEPDWNWRAAALRGLGPVLTTPLGGNYLLYRTPHGIKE
jgi:hypothetical protein